MLPLNQHRDDLTLSHTVASMVQDTVLGERKNVSSACLCGSRLPLQVRLGFRSRTRPVVEGRWCCSEQCLHARVASFVRRGMSTQTWQQEHQHRIPLGLLLLSQGAISQEQLRYARHRSESTGEPLGDILVRHCGLPEERLSRGIATQWGCSSWDVTGTIPDGMACIAPHAVLRATGMLPLKLQVDGSISIAFVDAPNASAVFAVRRIHDCPVDTGIAGARDFLEATNQLMTRKAVPVEEHHCDDDAEVIRLLVRAIQHLAPVECRWVRLHGMFWVRMWLEPSAVAGGICQTEDVMDFVFHLPSASQKVSKLKPL